jgi:hypothetical protein
LISSLRIQCEKHILWCSEDKKGLHVVCLFIATWVIGQLSRSFNHNRWQGSKSRPMLSTYGSYQWGLFYVPCLLWHRTSVHAVSLEGPALTYPTVIFKRATQESDTVTLITVICGQWKEICIKLRSMCTSLKKNWNYCMISSIPVNWCPGNKFLDVFSILWSKEAIQYEYHLLTQVHF